MDEKEMKESKELLQHQIIVEDDERKFTHDNVWTSCCSRADKRAVSYLTQVVLSGANVGFGLAILAKDQECPSFSRYLPLLTLVIGVWLPSPRTQN